VDLVPDTLQVAIPLFPRFTALDGIGPYEVLQRIPSIDVTFIGHERGEVRSDNGMLGLTADAAFEELTEPDVIVFPGGVGTRILQHDERVLEWVRHHPLYHLGLYGLAGARRRRLADRTHRHHPLVVLSGTGSPWRRRHRSTRGGALGKAAHHGRRRLERH
jgi:hypothetical protein